MKVSAILGMDRLFHAVVGTEFLKLRRAKVAWISFLAYGFMVAIAGFFVWMMKNPALAERLGLVGQKANFMIGGRAIDWATFLDLVVEMSGLGGLMLLSVIVAFVFGREYAEGTAKNMLALPVPRPLFVAAKLIVVATWIAALTLWCTALTLVAGSLLGLPGLSTRLLVEASGKMWVAALMSFCLSAAVAWVSVETRGYLAPLGFAIGALVLGVAFGATEWGRFCPWSILLWYTGAGGPGRVVGPGSYAVLGGFFAVGVFLAVRHEACADNAQ
jgi:ABC-2 type transport system permease protein